LCNYINAIKTGFDKAKNERNITLRGLPFDLAADLDRDNVNIIEDTRKAYGEPGFITYGLVKRLAQKIKPLKKPRHNACDLQTALDCQCLSTPARQEPRK